MSRKQWSDKDATKFEDTYGILTRCFRHGLTSTTARAFAVATTSALHLADERSSLECQGTDVLIQIALDLTSLRQDILALVTLRTLELYQEKRNSSLELEDGNTWRAFLDILCERIREVDDQFLELTAQWLFTELCKHLASDDPLYPSTLVIIKKLFTQCQPEPDWSLYQNIFQKAALKLEVQELAKLEKYADTERNEPLKLFLLRFQNRYEQPKERTAAP